MTLDRGISCHPSAVQNPRIQPWRKLVILRGLRSLDGDCSKRGNDSERRLTLQVSGRQERSDEGTQQRCRWALRSTCRLERIFNRMACSPSP